MKMDLRITLVLLLEEGTGFPTAMQEKPACNNWFLQSLPSFFSSSLPPSLSHPPFLWF